MKARQRTALRGAGKGLIIEEKGLGNGKKKGKQRNKRKKKGDGRGKIWDGRSETKEERENPLHWSRLVLPRREGNHHRGKESR